MSRSSVVCKPSTRAMVGKSAVAQPRGPVVHQHVSSNTACLFPLRFRLHSPQSSALRRYTQHAPCPQQSPTPLSAASPTLPTPGGPSSSREAETKSALASLLLPSAQGWPAERAARMSMIRSATPAIQERPGVQCKKVQDLGTHSPCAVQVQ